MTALHIRQTNAGEGNAYDSKTTEIIIYPKKSELLQFSRLMSVEEIF